MAVHRNLWEAFPAGPAAWKEVCKECIQVFCTGMEFCKNIKLLIHQSCLTLRLPCEWIVNYLPYATEEAEDATESRIRSIWALAPGPLPCSLLVCRMRPVPRRPAPNHTTTPLQAQPAVVLFIFLRLGV